jgi:signal transduction histidine kinase
MRKRIKKIVNLNLLIFAIAIYCLPSQVFAAKQDIKIGVLAYRGIEQCHNEWNSTADYLTAVIPEHVFKIIPLSFDKVNTAVTNREIDFIITNSSNYVELEQKYFCSRIATLVNKSLGKGCTVFGGVIFFRADRHDIKTLADLHGKKFVAADENSLGGWRTAWGELKKAGINPYKDFTELRFAGTHDAAVFAVRDKVADAGTVRTDTLERMSAEGKISLQEFQIIPFHGIGPEYDNFPFLLSTRLYPEWPIAKLRHTSDELARKVAAALLTLPSHSPAARSAKVEGWTIPYNYESVEELLKFLRVGPYENFGKVTLKDAVREYWHLILSFGALLCSLVLGLLYVAKLNANLKISRRQLETTTRGILELNREMEALVMERTMSEMALGIADGIRNPLHIIGGFSHRLLEKTDPDDPARAWAEVIAAEAKRLEEVVGRFEALAQRKESFFSQEDLNNIVQDTLDMLQVELENRQLHLVTEPSAYPIVGRFNKHLLKIALSHLLRNAIEATPPRGVIRVNTSVDRNFAVMVIQDTGRGMAAEAVAKVFIPFYTTKIGGTGLGMVFVRQIVDDHRGVITLESKAGKGTTVTVRLPLRFAEPPEVTAEPSSPIPGSATEPE